MLSIFIRTIIIYVILNIMLKIMGKRQIGELEVNELVSTLLISEIASAPITDGDIPLLYAIIPVLFISTTEIVLSYAKNKIPVLKRVIEGKSTYIIYKGKIQQKMLKENRISINELLTEMRIQGIGDPFDVKYAILEQNGKISLFQKKDQTVQILITDGDFVKENLSALGLSEVDVKKLLGKTPIENVFLMTIDESGKTRILKKEKDL